MKLLIVALKRYTMNAVAVTHYVGSHVTILANPTVRMILVYLGVKELQIKTYLDYIFYIPSLCFY